MRPFTTSAQAQGVRRGDDDVLELRVHGVANTPPAAMLGLREDQLVQLDGDDLGSFWAAAPGVGPFPADDPRQPPAGVRREAYSWGAMARLSTLPGVGRVTGTLAGVARALWVLIIPFGFANVAYWARDLDEPTGRRSSASGGLVRLFGLVLTLLWTVTAATVTLGLVGAQCYRPRAELPGGGGTYVLTCRALPGAIDSWARWSVGTRTAVLAGVAAACVLVLAGIGSTGRLRYERRTSTTRARGLAPAPGAVARDWPVLARHGFWTRSMRSAVLWMQHLTGAFALLAGVLAWHFLFRHEPGCVALHGFGANGCLAGTLDAGRWPWTAMLAASVLLVLWVAWRVARLRLEPLPPGPGVRDGAPDRVSRAPDAVALVLALGVFGWCLAVVATSGDAPLTGVPPAGVVPARPLLLGATGAFAGLDDLPMLLAAVLLLLAVVALGLRARVAAFVWAPLVVVALGCALGALMWPTGATAATCWLVAGVATAVLVVVVAVAGGRVPGRVRLGWGGRGPFVFLVCAAGLAMVLSSATVLGVVAWLERPGKPEASAVPASVADALKSVDAADPLRTPILVDVPAQTSPHLQVPAGYEQFAVASIGVLALFAVFIVVLVLRMVGLGHRPVTDAPRPAGVPGPPRARSATPDDAAIQAGRHHAALAQRAERVVGALAWLFLAALVATLLLPPAHAQLGGAAGAVWDWAVQWSTSAVVACVGVLVTSVVVAGSKQPLTRPFGLLWDLMCFLPRAAHPFAPPCYTERVVPELRSRIDAWLGDDGGEQPVPPGRRVVLSVHSLGAVVAVQTLLARWDGPTGPFDGRVAVLSYGAQLRAYFGRFFPELFGPGVLGTRAVHGARVWAADPWLPALPTPDPRGLTLVDTLTTRGGRTRWRNLWRRTDFIGFPVDDYTPTPRHIDHRADELDPTAYMLAVAAHSGYPATRQYREQLDVLVGVLRRERWPARRT